ncbi:unnamed protein product [Rhizoctonia solani]|uniref:Amidase domain-containing protein n=1 Tax=Rhizoctonia solani TaxID=456999 RepID=A0A8H3E8T2_9AGAM|nr:unnamed protein product [Rhizoctonia solani]
MQPWIGLCFFSCFIIGVILPGASCSGPTSSLVPCSETSRFPDLYEASIRELECGLDNGYFTSVDLVKAYIKRIEQVNHKGPKLRAVLEINPRVLEQAALLDHERSNGAKRSPLHGIPMLVKDNIATWADEGMNTTAGSYALLGSIVPGDATVITKLRKAGAILLGKSNMSEWAAFRDWGLDSGWSGRGGQTTSPYYPGADPCGSSSGSGVATAIGLAAASLGTETDGSIICPSSYNNLIGIKPTVGLTSRAGVIPITLHQDTIGPMTRNVADAAIILSVIAGYDPKDNYTSTAPPIIPDYTSFLDPNAIRGKRFGVPRKVFTDDLATGNHPSINVEFNKALNTIRSLGGVVVDPADIPSVASADDWFMRILLPMYMVDFKVDLNEYFNSLNFIPTNVTTLEHLIAFNNNFPQLEQPGSYKGQSLFIESQKTKGYNASYFAALETKLKLGREEGIDAALRSHNLDALVLPSNGLTTAIAAMAAYPIVSGKAQFMVESTSLATDMVPVPLGFHPENVEIVTSSPSRGIFTTAAPHTFFPAPGMPFGLAFLGTAYSEPDLIGFAYAYEQKTRTRLGRRAFFSAIPSTQLEDLAKFSSTKNRLYSQFV